MATIKGAILFFIFRLGYIQFVHDNISRL